MWRVGVVILLTLSLFIFIEPVVAVTISLSNIPPSISDSEFILDVFVDGPKPGTNYLRIDLFKEGTSNYFGETFNGSSWYSGGEGEQYLPITIGEEGSASATLKGRLGLPTESEYPGPGSYKLKIRRYTSSGNAASSDDQTPASVEITWNRPQPTPTSNPSPTSEPTPKPSPTLLPTLKPTPKNSPSTLPIESIEEESSPLVLGETSDLVSFYPSSTASSSSTVSFQKIGGIFIFIAGLCFSAAGGYIAFKRIKPG